MNIESIKQFYNQHILKNRQLLKQITQNIYYLGSIRLVIVILGASSVYFFRNQGWLIILPLLLLFIVLFFVFVIKSNKLSEKKAYLESALARDNNELKAINYDFSAFDGASEKVNGTHPFSLDLDLFGNRSLFQCINRTCTSLGKVILSGWFENPLQDKQDILSRQEAIKELAADPDFIRHFEVTGLLHPGRLSDQDQLAEFINHPPQFTHNRLWQIFSYVTPLCWAVSICLASLGILSFSALTVIFILFLFISESMLKKVNNLQQQVGNRVEILKTYSALIYMIEGKDVQSGILKSLKGHFTGSGDSASASIKKLARLSGELEQRSNILVHMVLNPLLLWDIRKCIAIEKWKEKYKEALLSWIKALGEYDAFCSAGKFMFNHPGYVFPDISESYFELEGKALGHPLMHRDTCIKNDITISHDSYFMIVTGANMAGKSTYLRTVGINFMLACTGLPVCADYLRVYPAQLFTSLRTTDSLVENESYFFAELKRLKMIIDEILNGKKLFIILDEILKGTNSVDKQNGSLALVQRLIRLKSAGIIATHDLMLGKLEDQFPENIRNYCFEADINNDELTFSYKLRTGTAQNMNASFLMRKMGVTE